MIDAIMGDTGTRFIVAALAVAAGLVLLIFVLWLMRNRSSSTFIRGGKNRQPRLAVLDAAAVDTRRRLVLVRRDDVEHLIMIGGPTDIVIESRISGDAAAAVEPALEKPAAVEKTAQPAELQRPVRAEARQTPEEKMPGVVAPAARQVRPEPELKPVPELKPGPELKPAADVAQRPEAKPVSAMGQVLYSDAGRDEERPQPQVQPERRMNETPSGTATVAAGRDFRPEPAVQASAQMAVQGGQQPPMRQEPSVSNAAQASANPAVSPSLDAEDILDAARSRVLPRQEGARPAVQSGNPSESNAHQTPARTAAAATPLSDFESILDAEISGDLQRLAPQGNDPRAMEARPQGGRIDPTLEPSGASTARKEPTLEQEMARMLGEMSVNRKN